MIVGHVVFLHTAQAQLDRDTVRERKIQETREKLQERESRAMAARLAKEEEERLLAGMDELDALLYRQSMRFKVQRN